MGLDVFRFSLSSLVRAVLVLFFVGTALELVTTDAEARAGRGRSSGRSSFQSKRQQQQNHRDERNSQQPNQSGNQAGPNAASVNPSQGSFMRSMAGGIAGGFLGSMLFSSLGHAAGTGAAGGGIGILEIALIAGLGFLVFRWWRNRQQANLAFVGATQRYGSADIFPASGQKQDTGFETRQFLAFAPEAIDTEVASDIFFKIQGAWTRRDLTSVIDLLGADMKGVLEEDIAGLKRSGLINRLENISIRGTDVVESWREDELELSTVRFTASLLDYTVEESSGRITSGSDTDPVKFSEDWTFGREISSKVWRLYSIKCED